MRLSDVTIRAGRSLRQAKARTLLTSLAIGVGAFTIVLSFAAGAGGRAYVSDVVSSNTNTKELYVQPKQDQLTDPTKPQKYSEDPTINYGGGYAAKLLKQSDINKISKVKDVVVVTPYYMFNTKYVTMNGKGKYLAGLETYNESIKLDYAAGSSKGIEKDGVIVPDGYREVFGYKNASNMIGKKLLIVIEKGDSKQLTLETKTFEYKIVGVIKKSVMRVTASTAIQLHKNSMAILNDYNQKGTALYGTYAAATVLVDDDSHVNGVKTELKKSGYDAQTAEDLMSFIFQFINVLQGILIGFGALAVLTSVFGIINTQYISVLERTQQIGLMKALGMRRRDIGRLFKLEAAWIGFIGGSIGAGLAIISGTIANPYISNALGIGKTSLLIFEPTSVISVIFGLVIVSVVSGILPARKAAKLDPIEALRTE